MAIIDTGIDGNHTALDDLDDDNSTDPKVIAFFDAINNPGATNGSEIFPYDDNGHGTHCWNNCRNWSAYIPTCWSRTTRKSRWSESSQW